MWLLFFLIAVALILNSNVSAIPTDEKDRSKETGSKTSLTPQNPLQNWTIRASNIRGCHIVDFPFGGNLKEELEHSKLKDQHQVLISFLKDGKPSKFDSIFVPLNNDFDEFFLPNLNVSNSMYPMQTYDVGDRLEFSLRARWPDYSHVQFSSISLRAVDLERRNRYSQIIYRKDELHIPVTHLSIILTDWTIPKELGYVEKFHVICTYTAVCSKGYKSRLFEMVSMIDVLMETGESGDDNSSTFVSNNDTDEESDDENEIISNLWIGNPPVVAVPNGGKVDSSTNTPHKGYKEVYRTAKEDTNEPLSDAGEQKKPTFKNQGVGNDQNPTAPFSPIPSDDDYGRKQDSIASSSKSNLNHPTKFKGMFAANHIKKKGDGKRSIHNNFHVKDASFQIYFNSGVFQDVNMQVAK